MLRYDDDDGDDDSDDDNDDIDAFLRSLLQGENDTSSFSDNDSETADLVTFTEGAAAFHNRGTTIQAGITKCLLNSAYLWKKSATFYK